MSKGINKVIVVGNLGSDPESRYMDSGAVVCNFSVAASESWKDRQTGEQKERTEWIRVEVWGKTAEACIQYLAKGSQVYVEGKMRTDKYEKNGQDHYATKVRADNVQFLGSPRSGNAPPANQTGSTGDAQNQGGPKDFDDDIPF